MQKVILSTALTIVVCNDNQIIMTTILFYQTHSEPLIGISSTSIELIYV